MASVDILPPGATATLAPAEMVNTLAGTIMIEGTLTLKGMRLPGFDRNRVIKEHKFKTFSAPCKYDLILRADFLKKMGIKLDYKKLGIEWVGIKWPMNTIIFTKGHLHAFVDNYHMQMEEKTFVDNFDVIDSYAFNFL